VLNLKTAATLTLTGNTYSFCKVTLEGLSQLLIGLRSPAQGPLRIYLDSPENCPGVTGAGTMTVKGTSIMTNLNVDSDTLQIQAVGSPTTSTSIRFENTISNLIGTIYAPNSTVALENANGILGAVAAKRVTLEDTSRIVWHPSAADVTLDDLTPLFKRTSWVECTPRPTGSEPDSGCPSA
jgi:hypothetical protein